MNIFFFWVTIIGIIVGIYIFSLYRRSPKGFRFQVKLTTIFILLVLIPAIPLTFSVSAFLTRGMEMFLLPGVEESLSNSLDIIKYQLEKRGEIFYNNFSDFDKLNPEILQKNEVLYLAQLQFNDSNVDLYQFTGSGIEQFKQSPSQNPELFKSILQGDIKTRLFSVNGQYYCEVYQIIKPDKINVVAFQIDPGIINAKDNISESLRVYNSFSLLKKSVVEGQLIWGFSTIFIILLTIVAIYAAKSLSRGISEPINELTLGMQRMAAGDLSSLVKVNAKDEIKFLLDTFNKMAQELKTSQEKLVRAERLAAWQDVARRISHEIKNTLTPIQLSIRRLWNKLNAEDKINEASLLTIQEEVQSLRRISEEFSEFARMPRVQLQRENLNDLIKSLVTFIKAEPGVPPIRLELDESTPSVYLDRNQFRRALHNIVKNSIDASSEKSAGNDIFIRTSRISEKDKIVKIEIEDHGKGMEPEVLEKIFEPYFTTKKRGMGLGLAIVKKIIEDHNCEIEYQSKPGKGTRVVIYLSGNK